MGIFTTDDINFYRILAFFASLIMVYLFSLKFVEYLKKLNFGQQVRELGPKSHKKKSGTPTMGGLLFITVTVIVCSSMVTKFHKILIFALYMVAFGLVGFLDDYAKVKNNRNLGLTEKQKLLLQFLISLAFAIIDYKFYQGNIVRIPFMNTYFDMGIFYVIFISFAMIATTNAVNLTDGLDGLAATVTATVMIFFAIISYLTKNIESELFSLIVAGGLIGFLRINKYPAKCFMGDTGSMALGGAVCAVAISLKNPFLIVILGLIYVIEALSVVLQVSYYKKTKKRIFKMSPYHHHLELSGFHETKIVKIFTISTVLCGILGIISVL